MPNGHTQSNHSKRKIIVSCLGTFAILILAFVLCLPTLFSTSYGKKMLASMVNKRTGLSLNIDQMSLSWFGSQSLKGVFAIKPEEQLSLTCQEITTDASLIDLIFKNQIGQLKIMAPDLQISKPFQAISHLKKIQVQNSAFTTALQVELGMPMMISNIGGQITVEKGKLRFNPPGLDPILFEQIRASAEMQQKGQVAFDLSCNTQQHQNQGSISIKGAASHLNFSTQSSITNLPVQGIDQLVSLFSPQSNGLLIGALGDTINLQCDFKSSKGNFDLILNAQSPQMSAQIMTQSANGLLTLKNPATFNFNITPLFLRQLAKLIPSLSTLSLAKPALFQLTLSEFSCPLPTDINDLSKASFQAFLAAPSELPLLLNEKPLALKNFIVKANAQALDQGVLLQAVSQLQTLGQIGSFNLDGKIVLLENKQLSGNFSFKTTRFPIDFIQAFVSSTIPFSKIFGPSCDLNAELDLDSPNPKFHFSWQSDYLSIPSFDISLSTPWTLSSPALFTFGLSPELINLLFPDKKNNLTGAQLIQGSIQNLVLAPNNVRNIQLDASLNAKQIVLNQETPLIFSPLQILLAINTLDKISLQIDGNPIKASLLGAFDLKTQQFVLNKPLTMQCTLDNALLKNFNLPNVQLVKPAELLFSIDPFTLPLNTMSIDKLSLKGQLSATQLTLASQPQGKEVSIQNLLMPFEWNSKTNNASLNLSAKVQNPSNAAGNVQAQLALSQLSSEKGLNFTQTNINGTVDLQNISSTFLDAIYGNLKLSALIGPSFSSQIKLQSGVDKQNLAIKWTSPNLNVDSAFDITENRIRLQGTQLIWTLTSEGYRALDAMLTGPTTNMVPFEIKEPSTFTISLAKMDVPLIPKKATGSFSDRIPEIDPDIHSLQISASGSSPKLSFYDKSSQELIQLSSLSFSVNKQSPKSPIDMLFDTSVLTQSLTSGSGQNLKSGSVSLKGKLETTVTSEGQFDISQLTGDLDLKVQQLPSRVLDIIARAKGRTDFPFTTVFGNVINATLSSSLKNFNGPLSLNLNSPLTRASLTGHIVSGALLLDESIYAQIKITPEISRLVLKEINPLNLSYVYSKDPITLEIPADGFYFPFYPLNLGKIAIPDATIELGKISCKNEGNVNIALGLLKTKQFEKNGDLNLWFAPIEFSVQKGLVDIDRTEILLADAFDICLWGKVDLLKDYVDMVLGLTAQSLNKAFGIKNLPEKYVLTIPMKGPADNVQINTGKATAKVALLLAWQQKNIAGAIGGGPAGAIVGELLGKMATLPDSDAKVPPAKHPFPWEIGQQPKKTSHNPHEKRRHFKQNDKPLKQIFKVLK